MNTRATAFLWRRALPRLPWLAASALISIVCIAGGAALLAVSGYLIQQASTRPPILSLTVASVGVRLFSLLRASARYLERLTTHDAVLRLLEDTRVAVFRAVEPRSPAAYERDRSGDMMRRIAADVETLQDVYARGVLPPLVALLVIASATVIAAVLSGELGLALAVTMTLGAAAIVLASTLTARGAARRLADLSGELTAEITDVIQGCADLVGAGAMERRLTRIARLDAATVRESRRLGWSRAAASALVTLATGATVLAALVAATLAVRAGTLPAISVGITALAAMAIGEAFATLPAAVDAIRGGVAAARRLVDVMERPLPVPPPLTAAPLAASSQVSLRDVSAHYAAGADTAIDGVSLDLLPGRRIGVVGPSGSGKSTLASVLVRFRDFDAGTYTLGGVDVRTLADGDVRRRVGLVAQDAHIFATSVRENLRLARPAATDAELRDAAQRAHLLPWIDSLPAAWDTRVGEHGAHMSGGQRRRLALARALLAGFDVLIADEPTEALDERTASAVIGDLLQSARGSALLVISHRARDLLGMDEVFEMRDGRLARLSSR